MRTRKKMVQWSAVNQEVPTYEYESRAPIYVYTGIGCILSFIFVYSAVNMLNNVFPEFQFTSPGFLLMDLEILAICLWNGLLDDKKYRILRHVGNLMFLVMVGIFLGNYYAKNSINLQDGFLYMVQMYLNKWNTYYLTSIYVDAGDKQYIAIACSFLMIAVVAVVQMIASATKKHYILTILPFTALILDLLIGFTPEWFALGGMFLGMLFVFSHTWQRKKTYDQLFLLIALCVGILFATTGIFRYPAKQIAGAEKQMKQVQLNLENVIKNFSLFPVTFQDGKVDNHTPSYKNKEVIKIELDDTLSNIYLRGYYGMDYVNGGWISDGLAFEQACQNHNINLQKGAEILAGLPYASLEQVEQKAPLGFRIYDVNYNISYTGIRDTYTYIPYVTDVKGKDLPIDVNGDYDLRKEKSQKSIQVVGSRTNEYTNTLFADESVAYEELQVPILEGEENTFANWYDNFAESTYLTVPDEQITAKEIAHAIWRSYNNSLGARTKSYLESYTTNNERLQLATETIKYLYSNEKYNLNLTNLPAGADPIEYFLSTSHEGYCVHFASAGVFILREMGVPARYVTGYVGKENAYQFNKDTNQYELSIKDSNAHAWVEIYLERYGWTPVEMTPGNSRYWDNYVTLAMDNGDTIAQPNSAQKNKTTDTTNSQTEKNQNALDSENTLDSNTVNDSEETLTETEVDSTEVDDLSNDGSGLGGSGNGKHAGNTTNTITAFRIIVIVVGVLLIVAMILFFGWIWPMRKEKNLQIKLRSNLKHKHYNQAVIKMNQSLFRDLKKNKKRFWQMNLTDEEYLRELIGAYPQIKVEEWDRFFEIARKAAYSNQELTEDEAGFCYRIYKTHLHYTK